MESAPKTLVLPRSERGKLFALLLLFGVALTSAAQEPEFMKRGATRGALSSIDSVNLRSGNGMLNLPIGPTIKIGGQMSFGLQLIYNSKIWDIKEGSPFNPMSGTFPVSFPSRKSTAGVGWTLSLGRLIGPNNPINQTEHWMYIGPDGTEHLLYDLPFRGQTSDPQLPTWYSRDGSYLRMQLIDGERHIQMPSGVVHVFDAGRRLVRIHDRFPEPNFLNISYTGSDPADARVNHRVTATDSHGRVWVLAYENAELSGHGPIQLLHRVEIPTYGQGSATYDFEYQWTEVQAGCHARFPNVPTAYAMPLLAAVVLPGATASTPEVERMRYELDYYPSDIAGSNADRCRQGIVREVRLPTGGRIVWDHFRLDIPGHCQRPGPPDGNFFWSRTPAVISREYFDIDGTSLAKWSYSYRASLPPDSDLGTSFFRCPQGADDLVEAPEALRVREHLPTGDFTDHFFTIWPLTEASEHGADLFHFNMPYVLPGIEGVGFPTDIDYQDSGGRYLSQLSYDCDENGTCDRFRARYVRYEAEFPPISRVRDELKYDAAHRNDRIVSARTVHFAAGGESYGAVVDRSDFDGLGHFRSTETHSSFPGEASTQLFRSYNPDLGTLYVGDNHLIDTPPGEEPYMMPGLEEPWVLGTFDVEEREEADLGRRIEFLFDQENGFLERRRVWLDTGPLSDLDAKANDVVTLFERSESGNVVAISTYGGDRQNDLGTGELTNLQLGDDWEYRVERIYDGGHVKKVTEFGRERSSLVTKDLDLDADTGLPTMSRDASGVSTGYSYDRLGRLVEVTPAAEARYEAIWTNASWSSPTSGENESAEVRRVNGTDVLSRQQIVRDGFGRNLLEAELFPGDQWSTTRYEYGSNGLLSRISTPHWDGHSILGWTELNSYDPLGRPLETIDPDGKVIRLAIDREHRFTTTTSIATDLFGTESEVERSVMKDSRGRIVSVEELSDEGSAVITSYSYDVGGRLAQVSTPYPGGVQERFFDYDNRGFRISEQHPEKGPDGGGLVSYEDYDSRGNAGRVIDGHHLRETRFDDLGRPVQIWDGAAPARLMIERFYSRENLGLGEANKALGKLVEERRHNYLDGVGTPVIITERYEYHDTQGRLSSHRTRSNTGFDVSQTMEYDALGHLERYHYPVQDLLPGAGDGVRSVTSSWQEGHMVGLDTSVAGQGTASVIDSMTYNPQGIVSLRAHSNGVDDHFEASGFGIARPRRMYTEGVASEQNWNSGFYEFDGGGNISAIGGDHFAYDEVERLVEAEVSDLRQSFRYDRFGNLLQLGDLERSYDPATNRQPASPSRYDAAGNVISQPAGAASPARQLTYDVFDRMVSRAAEGLTDRYVYGPGHERVAALASSGLETWTLRDPSHRVVREYTRQEGGPFQASRDYFYADRLVSSLSEGPLGGVRHYHLDHLGSTRQITDGEGTKVSAHTYLPFGEELADPGNQLPDGERLKFTGHERDAADQDYMHARYYGNEAGRFWGIDPVLGSVGRPQSWNRYVYAANNPLIMIDPDGRQAGPFGTDPFPTELIEDPVARPTVEPEGSDQVFVFGEAGVGAKGLAGAAAKFGAIIEDTGSSFELTGVRVDLEASFGGDFSPVSFEINDAGADGSVGPVGAGFDVGPTDAAMFEGSAEINTPIAKVTLDGSGLSAQGQASSQLNAEGKASFQLRKYDLQNGIENAIATLTEGFSKMRMTVYNAVTKATESMNPSD